MNRASKSTLRQGVVTDWRWLLPLITISLLIVVLSLWAYRLFSAEIRDEAVRTLAGIESEGGLSFNDLKIIIIGSVNRPNFF